MPKITVLTGLTPCAAAGNVVVGGGAVGLDGILVVTANDLDARVGDLVLATVNAIVTVSGPTSRAQLLSANVLTPGVITFVLRNTNDTANATGTQETISYLILLKG